MIKLIRDEVFVPDLNKSIHYISWTPYHAMSTTDYAQMSWVYEIARENLPGIDLDKAFRTIDYFNETGTFPQANITIMPSYRQPYSDEAVYKHFNDAMKAQNQLIHAENIIFDMRYYAYINPHTNDVDDEEYLEMIDHSTTTMEVVSSMTGSKKATVYVILLREYRNKYRHVQFQYANDEEVEALKLK